MVAALRLMPGVRPTLSVARKRTSAEFALMIGMLDDPGNAWLVSCQGF